MRAKIQPTDLALVSERDRVMWKQPETVVSRCGISHDPSCRVGIVTLIYNEGHTNRANAAQLHLQMLGNVRKKYARPKRALARATAGVDGHLTECLQLMARDYVRSSRDPGRRRSAVADGKRASSSLVSFDWARAGRPTKLRLQA